MAQAFLTDKEGIKGILFTTMFESNPPTIRLLNVLSALIPVALVVVDILLFAFTDEVPEEGEVDEGGGDGGGERVGLLSPIATCKS